jgi:nucleotide-binding universal stress UspA family protein
MSRKRIILPTDFSKNARNAIKYAVDVFKDEDVEYYLLNVYREPHATSSSLVSIVDILQKSSEESLQREEKKIRDLFPSMKLELSTVSRYGDTTMQINKLAQENKVDYIVMGTKGATGLKEVLLGSVTADVIQGVKVPLLAVPDRCAFTGFERIGFAADLKEIKSKENLLPMLDLARDFGSRVEIVTVQREVEYASEEEAMVGLDIHEMLRGIDHQFVRRESDEVISGIEGYMRETTPDIMVLIPRKTSLWDRLFKISVTKKVALHAETPLLILQD